MSVPTDMPGLAREIASGVATSLPDITSKKSQSEQVRVVLVTSSDSPNAVDFCEAWHHWGFRPDAVIIRAPVPPTKLMRLSQFVRDNGIAALAMKVARRRVEHSSSAIASHAQQPQPESPSLSAYCASNNIPTVFVESLDSATGLETLRSVRPDLVVYAGYGIMRREALEIPRLGTVNAHMGLLPSMRGMNVAEWSALLGVQIGCTVHLIDPGIDTGDIVVFSPVDVAGVRDVSSLRARVRLEQTRLLGEVVRWTQQNGRLPFRRSQAASEGRQFFAMHPDIAKLLDAALATGSFDTAATAKAEMQ